MRATKNTGWFTCPICGGEYDRGYKVDFPDGTRRMHFCIRCCPLKWNRSVIIRTGKGGS